MTGRLGLGLWKPDIPEQGSELMATAFKKTSLSAIME